MKEIEVSETDVLVTKQTKERIESAELTKLKSDVARLEANLKEAESNGFMRHLECCAKVRHCGIQAHTCRERCTCGLDDFKSRAFLSKTTNG